MILWGPAGTGKTTLARILANSAGYATESLSAVTSGVKDVREALVRARERLGEHSQRTVLFIDEVHRFNKSQQDLLLPATETGQVVLIGATTENPYFEVNAALMSRATLWRLHPLSGEDLEVLVRRGVALRESADRPLQKPRHDLLRLGLGDPQVEVRHVGAVARPKRPVEGQKDEPSEECVGEVV